MNIKNIIELKKIKFTKPMIRVYFDNISNSNDILKYLNNIILLYKKSVFNNLVAVSLIYYSDSNDLKKRYQSFYRRGITDIYDKLYCEFNYIDYFVRAIILTILSIDIISTLNKIIIEKDFSIEPELYIDLYYLDEENQIIINPYDDRGLDIIFYSTDNLMTNIYEMLLNNGYKYEVISN